MFTDYLSGNLLLLFITPSLAFFIFAGIIYAFNKTLNRKVWVCFK